VCQCSTGLGSSPLIHPAGNARERTAAEALVVVTRYDCGRRSF